MCNKDDVCSCGTLSEKLAWSVCMNYAAEQISIGRACELLDCTVDTFKAIFQTFPYGSKFSVIDRLGGK